MHREFEVTNVSNMPSHTLTRNPDKQSTATKTSSVKSIKSRKLLEKGRTENQLLLQNNVAVEKRTKLEAEAKLALLKRKREITALQLQIRELNEQWSDNFRHFN